ncbi:hypothetical protein JXQ31_06925 [candidate division KSB1 bacterium]|nr:hypothetical protein [candidate division KSB1 bacterium]
MGGTLSTAHEWYTFKCPMTIIAPDQAKVEHFVWFMVVRKTEFAEQPLTGPETQAKPLMVCLFILGFPAQSGCIL